MSPSDQTTDRHLQPSFNRTSLPQKRQLAHSNTLDEDDQDDVPLLLRKINRKRKKQHSPVTLKHLATRNDKVCAEALTEAVDSDSCAQHSLDPVSSPKLQQRRKRRPRYLLSDSDDEEENYSNADNTMEHTPSTTPPLNQSVQRDHEQHQEQVNQDIQIESNIELLRQIMDEIGQTLLEDADETKMTLTYRLDSLHRFMNLYSKAASNHALAQIDSSQIPSIIKVMEQTVESAIYLDPIDSYVKTLRNNDTLPPPSSSSSLPLSVTGMAQRQTVESLANIYSVLDLIAKLFVLLSDGILEKEVVGEHLIVSSLQTVKNQLDNTVYPMVDADSYEQDTPDAYNDAQLVLGLADSNPKLKNILPRLLPLISRIIRRSHTLLQVDDMDDHTIVVLAYITMGPFFHYYIHHPNSSLVTLMNDDPPTSLSATTTTSNSGGARNDADHHQQQQQALVVNTFEHLKLTALDLLRHLFSLFPQHRHWILEEILTSIGSLTTTDYRETKRYRLIQYGNTPNHDETNDMIHILSALFMQLIQSSLSSVKHTHQAQRTWYKKWELKYQKVDDATKRKELDDALSDRALSVWKKGIDNAVQNTTYFLEYLMNKCKSRKKDNYSSAEYRTILECTIEDILLVLNDPDWPAAELILQVFTNILVSCIDSDKGDLYLRTSAIEWLGNIVGRLKTGYNLISGAHGAYTPEWLYQLNRLIPVKLQDQDQRSFHLLERCRMKLYQTVLEEMSESNTLQFYVSTWGYSTACAWKLCQARNADSSEETGEIVQDGNNAVSKFTEILASLQSACHRYWLLGLDMECPLPNITRYDFPEFNRDDLRLMVEFLASRHTLYRNMKFFISKLLQCLDKEVVTFRIKALRALGEIATSAPEILEDLYLRNTVIQRIYDASPSVRDAAVELIGKYLASQQVIQKKLYDVLSSRTMDTAPNVRKRLVKLLPELYNKFEDENIKIDIGARLLQRINDNEAVIQKLALKATQQVLFLPFRHIDQETDHSGNPFGSTLKDRKQKVMAWTGLITNAVGKLDGSLSGQNAVLSSLIQETLEKNDEKQRQWYEKIFQWIVDCLFEKMLILDESDNRQEFIHCIATIHAFAKAQPTLLNESQVYALLPYLSVTTSDDWSIGQYVMIIYRDVLPRIKHHDLDFCQMVENVLLQTLGKCPNAIVQDAISCLCAITTTISHRYSNLIKILGSCLASLNEDMKHSVRLKTVQKPTKTAKALLICGFLCQYFDFDSKRITEPDKMSDLNNVSKGKITNFVFESLKFFTNNILDNANINKQIKLAALKALGSLYCAHPTFMITRQSTDLLDSIFEADDVEMKTQLLNVFQCFLDTEESRIHKRSEAAGSTLYTKVIDVETLLGNTEEFAELGANGSLMQRYLVSILKCTLGSTNQLRLAAFDVVQTIINQGLAHPMMCMPSVVAAETSPDTIIRNKAYYLHIYLHNKFGNILYSQMDANLKAAFQYQTLLLGNKIKGYGKRGGDHADEALLGISYSVLQEKKSARTDFLLNLVKPFSIDLKEVSLSPDKMVDLSYLTFLADNLLTLPLTSTDELLCVLHAMERILVTTGIEVLSMIQQFKKEGLISVLSYMDDDDDDDASDDCNDGDDKRLDQHYIVISKAAIGLTVLIRTKDMLQTLYSVDDQEIHAYIPTMKSKPRAITRSLDESGRLDWKELAFFRLGSKLTSFTASDACLTFERQMDDQGNSQSLNLQKS